MPTPSEILTQAQASTKSRRYAEALRKHEWFHTHALRHDPGQYGVRLSFALSAWHDLAKRYAPAMTALLRTRRDTERKLRLARDRMRLFHLFHDCAAIDRTLGDDAETVRLFTWLDAKRPTFAKTALRVAQPALIRTKSYDLCARHIAAADFDAIRELRQATRKVADTPPFTDDPRDQKELLAHADHTFIRDSATLVALLTKTGRPADAKRVAARAAKTMTSPRLDKALASALRGRVPKP